MEYGLLNIFIVSPLGRFSTSIGCKCLCDSKNIKNIFWVLTKTRSFYSLTKKRSLHSLQKRQCCLIMNSQPLAINTDKIYIIESYLSSYAFICKVEYNRWSISHSRATLAPLLCIKTDPFPFGESPLNSIKGIKVQIVRLTYA